MRTLTLSDGFLSLIWQVIGHRLTLCVVSSTFTMPVIVLVAMFSGINMGKVIGNTCLQNNYCRIRVNKLFPVC